MNYYYSGNLVSAWPPIAGSTMIGSPPRAYLLEYCAAACVRESWRAQAEKIVLHYCGRLARTFTGFAHSLPAFTEAPLKSIIEATAANSRLKAENTYEGVRGWGSTAFMPMVKPAGPYRRAGGFRLICHIPRFENPFSSYLFH